MRIVSTEVYKLDSKGKIRTWQYEVDGAGWRTIAGLQDGQKVISDFTICTPKSQPTAEAQALFEAEAELAKKLKRDYHTTIESTATPKFFQPMLAEKYDPSAIGAGDLASVKLDGIRCVAKLDGLWTREGEPITSCPHIYDQLRSVFDIFPDIVIDGELYNHEFKDNFNELASIIRKKTPNADQLGRASRDIEFHVYDLVLGGDLTMTAFDRSALIPTIVSLAGDSIIPVLTQIVDTHDDMREFFGRCVALRYEGAMLRKRSAPYIQNRTKALLKYKDFMTAEFEVSRIDEGVGNWAGHAKSVEFIVRDGVGNEVLTEQGERPRAGIKGNKAFTKELLAKGAKIVTIRFFEMTPAGVPRFGVGIDWDREDI